MPIDSTPAISRTIISGSENFFRNSFHHGVRFAGVSTLEPWLRRLASTSSLVSPLILGVCDIGYKRESCKWLVSQNGGTKLDIKYRTVRI